MAVAFLGIPVIVALASQVNNIRILMATLSKIVILFQNNLQSQRLLDLHPYYLKKSNSNQNYVYY